MRPYARLVLVLLAAAAAVLALLYATTDVVETCYVLWRPWPQQILHVALSCALMLAVVAALARAAPAEWSRHAAALVAGLERHGRAVVAVTAVATTALAALTAVLVLDGYPSSADEFSHLFQAATFAGGRLWATPPPLAEAASTTYVLPVGDKWVSQYPPGWGAVLAAAEALRLPVTLVNPLLVGATVLLLAGLVRRESDRATAALAAIAYAATPFVLFNGASFFSHPTTALLVLLAVLALDRWLRAARWRDAALGGLAVGLVLLTRYLTIFAVALPFAGAALHAVLRGRVALPRAAQGALAFALGALPLAALLLAYHAAITGDPLKPVYLLGDFPHNRLFFDLPHILKGGTLTIARLIELTRWTSPLMVLGYAVALAWKLATGEARWYDLAFPTLVALFIFYPELGGVRWGPRYYFDLFPLMVATTATGLAGLARSAAARARPLVAAALAASLLYALLAYPLLAGQAAAVMRDQQDLDRQVAAARLDRAIVLVEADVGTLCPAAATLANLARNSVDADGPVVRLRGDLVDAVAARAAYPGRTLWRYRHSPEGGPATLVPAL